MFIEMDTNDGKTLPCNNLIYFAFSLVFVFFWLSHQVVKCAKNNVQNV